MTDTDADRLGRMLASARAVKGLSTPQLARVAGVSQSNIVRLELGKIARPRPETLQRLAHALELPPERLYGLAGLPQLRLQPYLRASYGLSATEAARAQAYIEQLAAGYGPADQGPDDGADEAPLNT